MKRNLMAVAVAGALAAPGLALAQATTAGTNIQIYGVLDVKWDSMKIGTSTTGTVSSIRKEHLATGAPNRIGFRGTEALGGGMTAFFQVETQVFTDARGDTGAQQTTNATLGGRPTFLGLRGAWGEVSGGYQESSYKDVYQTTWSVMPSNAMFGAIMGNGNTSGSMPTPSCVGAFAPGTNNFQGSDTAANPLGTAALGTQVGSVIAPVITPPAGAAATTIAASPICSEAPGSTTSFNRTVSDSIKYRSPVIAGFRFSTMFAVKEFKEPSSARPYTTANELNPSLGTYSLTWSGGPLSLAAAYEQHTGFRASNSPAVAANRSAKDTGITLGGRFNYGRGLIGLGWERLKYGNAAGAVADNSMTLKNWIVQGTFNLTPSDVLWAGYSKTPGRTACGAGLTTAGVVPTCGGATGAKWTTIGVDHSFSKRTAIYGYYSKIDNNAGATYNYLSDSRTTAQGAGAGGGLAAGQDSTSYNIGVKHSF